MTGLVWIAAAALAGCVASGAPSEATSEQAVLTVCDPGLGLLAMDPSKELIVRDLSVVEDPCRTSWTATGCAASTLGRWTFGHLMTTMSGATAIDSAQARGFVGKWLALWLTPQGVGADPTPVAPRTGIRAALLNRWLTDSGCAANSDPAACATLDLTQAPFRLLAIVNRVDLDSRGFGGTGGVPGEVRFVFGAFSRASASLAPVAMTVSLDYRFPARYGPLPFARSFHELGTMAFGAAFATRLQQLTDLVTERQLTGGNASAIGDVRTNENAFDSRPPAVRQWELRQFALPCTTGTCALAQIPVSQTPPTASNHSAALTSYLIANQASLATSQHVVPAALLGGSSLTPSSFNAVVWNTALGPDGLAALAVPGDPARSYAVRHNFGFSTCNGCHFQETSNQLSAFHIAPRAPGQVAPMSGFLSRALATDDLTSPSDYLMVDDPNPDSFDVSNGVPTMFLYNEPWRRSCEIRRVFAGLRLPVTTPTGQILAIPAGALPDPAF